MKILLGTVAGLCLVIGGISINTETSVTAAAEELVIDGGFNNGLTSWSGGWTSDETTCTKTVENGAVKLSNSVSGNQYVSQKVNLVAGETYQLNASIKTDSLVSEGDGTGGSIHISSSASEIGLAYVGYCGNGEDYGTTDWKDFSKTFTVTTSGEYSVYIRLWGASGTMWVDDVSLAYGDKFSIELDDGKFTSSNSFSANWNAGWLNTGATHAWDSASHTSDGTGSLKIVHPQGVTSSYAAESVNLVENAKYKVSGWIKTENVVATSVNDNVGAYFAFDEKYNFYFGKTVDTTDWTYYEAYYTATATGTHKLECKIWGATGTAYFDDIKIELIAEVDPEVLAHWTSDVTFPTDDGGFTLVGVGDTQGLAKEYNQRFLDCYDWLASNKDNYNIQYVMDLGDIVDDYTSVSQWQTAVAAHKKLQDTDLKYSISLGNHDYNGLINLASGVYVNRDSSTFNTHFQKSTYVQWLGNENFGCFNDTMDNTWHKFEAGGEKYLIIALEYGPDDDVLAWAKGVATVNADYHVIVTTHAYINGNGDLHNDAEAHLKDANGGEKIWDKFIRKCPNIFMILGGHYVSYGVSTSVVYGDAGNPIIQMKVDPQNILGNGEPMLAMYRITNGTDVSVYYYSTEQKKYYAGSNFSLRMDKGTENGRIEKKIDYVGKIFDFTALDGTTSNITYQSSDPTVATVAEDGTVTCLKSGTTTITCVIDGKQSAYATSGVLTKYTATLAVQEPVSISATYNTNGKTVYTTDTLERIKNYVTVTVTCNDGSTYETTDFTCAYQVGNALAVGDNDIVITAESLQTTIVVHATEKQVSDDNVGTDNNGDDNNEGGEGGENVADDVSANQNTGGCSASVAFTGTSIAALCGIALLFIKNCGKEE